MQVLVLRVLLLVEKIANKIEIIYIIIDIFNIKNECG
jgi:hypothetical protein